MKTFDIPIHFGAKQLNDAHPDRDAERGGTGKGLRFKRTVPLPETDKECAKAVEEFNILAEKKGWKVRLTLVDLYIKAASLLCQGEMHQRVRKQHGKAQEAGAATPDAPLSYPEV